MDPTPTPFLVEIVEQAGTAPTFFDQLAEPVPLVFISALVGFGISMLSSYVKGRSDLREKLRAEAREDRLRWQPEFLKAAAAFSQGVQKCFNAHLAEQEAPLADKEAKRELWRESYRLVGDAGVTLSLLAPTNVYEHAQRLYEKLSEFHTPEQLTDDAISAQNDYLQNEKVEFAKLGREFALRGY